MLWSLFFSSFTMTACRIICDEPDAETLARLNVSMTFVIQERGEYKREEAMDDASGSFLLRSHFHLTGITGTGRVWISASLCVLTLRLSVASNAAVDGSMSCSRWFDV
jgi:hypothetical protein